METVSEKTKSNDQEIIEYPDKMGRFGKFGGKFVPETLMPALDEWIANGLLDGQLLESPACLSPVPLMGIPGWRPGGVQDDEFYADHYVFRPMREGVNQAPVFFVGGRHAGDIQRRS